MIGCESLGAKARSAIYHISAVEFTDDAFTHRFDKYVSLESSLTSDAQVEARSLLWLLEQPEVVRMKVIYADTLLREVLCALSCEFDWTNTFVWTDTPLTFETLEGACDSCGVRPPWSAHQRMDLQTARNLVSIDTVAPENQDVVVNAYTVLEILEHLSKRDERFGRRAA